MLVIILTLPVEEIAKTAGAFQIVVYVLVNVALVAFRVRDPAWYEPDFRSPAYPWIQVFGVVGGIGILTQMDTLPLTGGVGIVVLGFAWYLVYGRRRVEREGILREAVTTGIEKETEERPYRVVVPVARPDEERGLLRMAASSAARHEDAEIVTVNVLTVPYQTSLSQEVAFEQERIERQRELLDKARDITEELGVGLRTHADGFDTVYVGATRSGIVERTLFGTLPEKVGEEASGTVVIVRGEEGAPRSVRQAIINRLRKTTVQGHV